MIFITFSARLAELQIIKGAYYEDLAESNRLRRVTISAPRGKIFARGGEVIVDNKPVYKRVVFDPMEGYEKIVAEESGQDSFKEWERQYLFGPEFAHVTGYLGETNKDEVGKIDPDCPQKMERKLGEFIGRSGLELIYDCSLRGIDGEELVEVDTFGNKLRTFDRRQPIAGSDLKTTLDLSLQRKISEIIAGQKAAVVVSDGKGEILSLVSSPTYDPNVFIEKNGSKISGLLNDGDLPLFDRALGGAYPPGSIFKLVTAIASLESGVVSRDFRYVDTGVVVVNTNVDVYTYYNWYFTQYGATEGEIDLARALARSTDTFFYKTGEQMGIDNLVSWAEKFGLGSVTGIDLPAESGGLLPTPEWKKAVKGERWFLGNTYHMSIGQGDLTTSVLQANMLTSVIANGGELCRPHINSEVSSDCVDLEIETDDLAYVKEGMVGACSIGGTAFPFFDFKPQVACKTGTAETYDDSEPHAWFTVFAPAENPEIVLTVFVEHGGEGSQIAAPIAREILDYWNLMKNP